MHASSRDEPSLLNLGEQHEEGEREAFEALQARLPDLFRQQFRDPMVPRTVIVLPSLSFHPDELAKIAGVSHYEERMLCMLMLLRLPRTTVIYLTSQRIDPAVIDYQLHLLAGVPSNHARRRLRLFSAEDASAIPLTQKLLERPRLLERIKAAIPDIDAAHLTCFTSTELERSLAVQLGVPLYACDPALLHLGTKSGSRDTFRAAGVDLPDGSEHLRDMQDVRSALARLKLKHPDLKRAVVKLNDGFSGEGNAVIDLRACEGDVEAWLAQHLAPNLAFEAPHETFEAYAEKFRDMCGIVECFVEGKDKRSPSVQIRVNPLGEAAPVSTHDQVLGGPSGQVFLGCTFPADESYRLAIQDLGVRIADVVRDQGVIGRFGVDFVSVPDGDGWKHYGLEINLRKGGTTHPLMVLHFLTDGHYAAKTGLFITPQGQPRYYYASDNVCSDRYRGLLPDDLIDIVVENGLHFHGATQQGVAFHLIGALSEFGKLGMVCIADSPASAQRLRDRTIAVIDRATEGVRRRSQPTLTKGEQT